MKYKKKPRRLLYKVLLGGTLKDFFWKTGETDALRCVALSLGTYDMLSCPVLPTWLMTW